MTKPPNILLITSDQQHFDTLGIVNPILQTPNLDRLAREGTYFTRAYCNSPVCSPSRSTVITGMYPPWHGCWNLGTKLPEYIPTIGDVYQQHGYATSLVGKAHFQPLASRPGIESLECQPTLRDLDFWRSFHGPWYGFENIEIARMHADESHVGQHYALWMEEKGFTHWRSYFRQWPPIDEEVRRQHHWDLPQELHYTTWTAERTIEAIERDVAIGRPFFTWASFHDPHPPYLVPSPWDTMYDANDMNPGSVAPGEMERMPPHFAKTQEQAPDFSAYAETRYPNHGFHTHLISPEDLRRNMAIYYGMVSFMDQEIGKILAALDRLGIADNTLVVFTTDHGHFLGQHGLIAKGAFHYEDLLRLPFLVRFPGKVPANRTSDALQSLVDLAPTFLAASGIEIPGVMQGMDQMPVWRGHQAKARDEVIVDFRHQPTLLHLRTYIDSRYKMTVYRDRAYGELFDLETDPQELQNLWDDPDQTPLKLNLLHKFENAEMRREPMPFPRIAEA
jgi:arylsulfatase A-like enzyme